MSFAALPRWPNLGFPARVHHAGEGKLALHVLFAGVSANQDLESALQGNLYLQRLVDTRLVKQEAMIFNVAQMGDAQKRLIPLRVVKVEKPSESDWSWYDLDFSHAYWVKLEMRSRDLTGVRIPQLFNLIQDFPTLSYYHVTYHAVYLHEKRWKNFTLAHVADPHISWRCEEIPFVIKQRMGREPKDYNNPNESFRDFIKFANARHRAGQLDLIILNGDLVDYVWENYYGRRPFPDRVSLNNFEFFTDLVKGDPRKQQCFVGQELHTVQSPKSEELEVPLFTTLGNHDFRPNEYPLIFDVQMDPPPFVPFEIAIFLAIYRHLFQKYYPFGLEQEEACAYEGGLQTWDDSTAAKFVAGTPDIPPTYRSLINPDGDYVINLGRHKIICLNTSCDEGIIQGKIDLLLSLFDESKKDFRNSSPDSAGFAEQQIQFLKKEIETTEGTVIAVCHAPALNIHGNTPYHLLRETEHGNLSDKQKGELWAYLWSEGFVFSDPTTGKPESPDKDGCLPLSGWSVGATPWFKKGNRDPHLGKGVADHQFEPFVKALASADPQHDKAALCLSGHTHRSIEYVVRHQDGELRYFHDYYLDNTIHGRNGAPEYPDALSKLQGDTQAAKKWWRRHTPLLVQTLSLGPIPAEQRHGGFMLITFKDDVITDIERVDLDKLTTSPSSQAWFILSSAPQ